MLFTWEMVLLLFIFWEFLDSFISTSIGYNDTNLDVKDFVKLSKYCWFNCFNIGSLIGFVRCISEVALVPTILRLMKGLVHLFWSETIVENCSFLWCFLQSSLSLLVHIHWQMEHAILFTTYLIYRVIMKKQSQYMRA